MRTLILLLALSLLTACSTPPARQDAIRDTRDARMNELVMYAMSLAETPYRYGGNSAATGFDCSGYVGHVYREVLDIRLPRTSREISKVGTPLSQRELSPGDLVFFNTRHRPYSHVGIYVGDGKFVHSPRTGSQIRVENMDFDYWKARYNGARRIN
ncbi:MAG: C40 family peptidase [Pseudomonadota bacterium]